MAGRPAELAATVTPLRLGASLIEVDTGEPDATARAGGAFGTTLTAKLAPGAGLRWLCTELAIIELMREYC